MLILAGAGEPGILYYLEKKEQGTNIDFIIDNDPLVLGNRFFEHKINSPQVLSKITEKSGVKVIITSVVGYEKFEAQILGAGIPKKNITRLKKHSERFKRNQKISVNDISDVINLLNRTGVKSVPAYGTLLGLIRDGKLLPYDDDVDTWILEASLAGITEKVLDKIKNNIFPDAGFMRIRRHYLPENKFCDLTDPAKLALTLYSSDRTYLRIDFFLLCRSGNYYYTTHNQKDLYRLPVELFGSISHFNAAGRNHIVPSKYRKILKTIYGEWRIPVKPNEEHGQYYGHLHKIDHLT